MSIKDIVSLQPQEERPKKKRSRNWIIPSVVGIGALSCGLVIGTRTVPPTVIAPTVTTTTTKTLVEPRATVTVPVPPVTITVPQAPPPGSGITNDGTYRVGVDIEPGKYRSAGPRTSIPGYFEIRKDPFGSGVDNIIDNDNPTGAALVTLAAGQGFSTDRMQTWTKVG
jgi:hypothetical protein